MYVTKRMYCNLVVWSPDKLYVERIVRDVLWWKEKPEQEILLHSKCVMPQLCAKYFTSKSCLAELNTVQTAIATPRCVPAGNTDKYCICGSSDDGSKMICCHSACPHTKPQGTLTLFFSFVQNKLLLFIINIYININISRHHRNYQFRCRVIQLTQMFIHL